MVEGSKEKDFVKEKNSRQDVFWKNGVLKSFAIYKQKCLHWSHFLINLRVFSMQLHPKNLLQYKFFTVNFAELLIDFYIHTSMTASERALDFTKNFSVFKASCEKEFVLFSLFIPAQIQVWARINWCWCGTSYAIFTCLASGVWWIPHSMERFYGCVTKSVLVGVCFNKSHINCILIIFLSLAAIFHLSKS